MPKCASRIVRLPNNATPVEEQFCWAKSKQTYFYPSAII